VFSACEKESAAGTSNPITPIVNDSNYVQYGIPFTHLPASEDLVIYEVNLRAFSSSGDLQGVTNRLDQLQNLGVKVIWLMPIHPIGEVNSVNSPYSVKDFKAVSSEYGSLANLRTLTDEAHKRNMAIMMDWVANHTAWDNEWMVNKDWYTQDASGNVTHPPGTNWLDVADLNFSSTEMRLAMIDAMKYWILEANVDGFRCDYADGVPFDFWKQALDSLKAIPNRNLVLLAEGARADHFDAGFDLNYGWNFYGGLKNVFNGQSANRLWNINNEEYNNIAAGKHILRFSTNHDESAWDNTPMVLFNGKDGAIAASVISFYMGGVPLLYTGQEVGRLNPLPFFSNSPINWNANPDMLQEYQDLLALYSQSPSLRKGSITNYPDVDIVAFTKTLANEEFLILVNVRDITVNYSLPSALQNSQWTDALSGNTINLATTLALANYQYLVLKK
tara:strand:+ start:3328 stop:4665 length:1338 start_codon:yes stop_codon:yes gene_type:complete